jgi:LysM repeat protein
MGAERQSSLRVLAPAALAVFAVMLLIVVIASISGGDGGSSSKKSQSTPAATQNKSQRSSQGVRKPIQQRRFYTVKPGDNLATIAEQTGVSLEDLRALNPTLDPQGLVSGQRVKLPPPSG